MILADILHTRIRFLEKGPDPADQNEQDKKNGSGSATLKTKDLQSNSQLKTIKKRKIFS